MIPISLCRLVLSPTLPIAFAISAWGAFAQEAEPEAPKDKSVEISGVVVGGLTEEEAAAAAEIDENQILVERKICEYYTPTGSIRPKKICRTRSQAEYESEVARETIRILHERQQSDEFTRMRRRSGGL